MGVVPGATHWGDQGCAMQPVQKSSQHVQHYAAWNWNVLGQRLIPLKILVGGLGVTWPLQPK